MNGTAAPFHVSISTVATSLTVAVGPMTIIIKYDEISPFKVNVILCHRYCSIVAVKELCREWHDGVVQYALNVSVSESLPLPLPQAPANKYYVIVLCWHQSHAVCFVLSLVLISVQRTIFTRLQKPGFMVIVKSNTTLTRAS